MKCFAYRDESQTMKPVSAIALAEGIVLVECETCSRLLATHTCQICAIALLRSLLCQRRKVYVSLAGGGRRCRNCSSTLRRGCVFERCPRLGAAMNNRFLPFRFSRAKALLMMHCVDVTADFENVSDPVCTMFAVSTRHSSQRFHQPDMQFGP